MIKYVICPDYMKSKNDGDIHYIGYSRLIELYSVNPAECVKYNDYDNFDNLIHLYPRYSGEYTT